MATRSKTPAKRKGTKVPAKKTATKKAASKKKVVAKKKAVAKKSAPSKRTVLAKKTTARRPVARKAKPTVPKKRIPKKEPFIKQTEVQKPEEINNDSVVIDKVETTLPAVEENIPVVKIDTSGMLGTDKKSLQRAAVRHYDNHRLRLNSFRKGGKKQSNKKPLW
jgi:hypothetical protein